MCTLQACKRACSKLGKLLKIRRKEFVGALCCMLNFGFQFPRFVRLAYLFFNFPQFQVSLHFIS